MYTESLVYEGTWEEIAVHEAELRGRKLRVTVIPESAESLSLLDRQSFLKLPMTERRRLLAEQTERMLAHYERDTEWRELQGGDIVEY